MTITDLLDTEIMQVLGLDTAREEASLLLQQLYDMYSEDNVAGIEELPPVEAAVFDQPTRHDQPVKSAQQDLWGTMEMPSGGNLTGGVVQVDQAKLAMLMDIPLKVSVILGRTRRPIKDVLSFTPGSIVELSAVIDEPVEVLVNGTLVAKGEVVVINENFGVRIIEIISPGERLQKVMT
jgi:flagellar motor switch protein FliN/FliY